MNDYSTVPREGIYFSKTDPSLRISVNEVNIVEDEGPTDELYYIVNWIEGEDESDLSAIEYEFDSTEWQVFVKSEQLEFDHDPYLDSIHESSHLGKIRDMLAQVKKNDCS